MNEFEIKPFELRTAAQLIVLKEPSKIEIQAIGNSEEIKSDQQNDYSYLLILF